MLFHQVNIKWKDTALLHQGLQPALKYVHLLSENLWEVQASFALRTGHLNSQRTNTDASNVLAFQNMYFWKSFYSKSVFSFSQKLHAKNSFICML